MGCCTSPEWLASAFCGERIASVRQCDSVVRCHSGEEQRCSSVFIEWGVCSDSAYRTSHRIGEHPEGILCSAFTLRHSSQVEWHNVFCLHPPPLLSGRVAQCVLPSPSATPLRSSGTMCPRKVVAWGALASVRTKTLSGCDLRGFNIFRNNEGSVYDFEQVVGLACMQKEGWGLGLMGWVA